MAKGKKKRQQSRRFVLPQALRRYRKWLRSLAVVGVVAAGLGIFALVVVLTSSSPTAMDENGNEVQAGVVERPGAEAESGSLAPNFLLPDYQKQAVRLDSFEGKLVFVNFWASWCTFCEEEMPDIVKIAERFPDDLVVIAINRGESKGTAEKWTHNHDFPELPNMHWILDPEEEVARAYRVNGMPQSFFIDPDGSVRTEIRRVTEYDEMLSIIDRAIETDTSEVSS